VHSSPLHHRIPSSSVVLPPPLANAAEGKLTPELEPLLSSEEEPYSAGIPPHSLSEENAEAVDRLLQLGPGAEKVPSLEDAVGANNNTDRVLTFEEAGGHPVASKAGSMFSRELAAAADDVVAAQRQEE
jgi:hypothetical protein